MSELLAVLIALLSFLAAEPPEPAVVDTPLSTTPDDTCLTQCGRTLTEEVISPAPVFVPAEDDPYLSSVATSYPVTEEENGLTWSDGWVTSPYTGNLVCVTAAPCEGDPQFRGAVDSSYNWVTGEVN